MIALSIIKISVIIVYSRSPEPVAEVLRATQPRVILTTSCMFAGSGMCR